MLAEKSELLRKYVDEGMRKGHIRESDSPVGSAILFVPKGKKEYRVYINYRGVNNETVKNSYPLPLIHDLQDRL